MGRFNRGISAKQLVRDYGTTLSDFTAQVDSLVTRLPESEISMPVAERRREVCVAIWAAITAAFDASAL